MADFVCGTITARYLYNAEHDAVELALLPAARLGDAVERREKDYIHPWLSRYVKMQTSSEPWPDSIVQVALRGEEHSPMFSFGHSMRNGETTRALGLRGQTVSETDDALTVTTVLATPAGLVATHTLTWRKALPGLLCETSVANEGGAPVVLEHVSSFSLHHLTPFAADDAPGRLRLHRFRSAWALEGRHEDLLLEDHHLERTWSSLSNIMRFGQVGSMPVRGFFPFAAVEDREAGVIWGAQLAWHGSWQIEALRAGDPLTLAGSLADYDFGQWSKTLRPGERFAAPAAILGCATGGIDELSQQLVATQEVFTHDEPESEADMPILFNEFCSTWGNPTHDIMVDTARRLQGTGTRYLVIDDGWAERPGDEFQVNGDWMLDRKRFPEGMKACADELRALGYVPGIWYEFEVATRGSQAYEQTDHQLKRHGQVIKVGKRHFWDLRDPWTRDYLREKVTQFLKDNNLGYMKVDYNDTFGVGADVESDAAAGLGEGNRQQLVAVQDFFAEIRREIPELVFECCSSGGHRLVPNLVGLTSMSSFSDAHEPPEIPIIAAALHRLVPARKNQIWVVIRPDDDRQRLAYSFAAAFLGRMTVSGDVAEMTREQFAFLKHAQAFYISVSHIIRDGYSRLQDEHLGKSFRHPRGWQALVRESTDGGECLIVAHAFEEASPELAIDLPAGEWSVAGTLADSPVKIAGNQCLLTLPGDFHGEVIRLKRT